MAQDTALLRYLLKRGHGGANGGRDLAFAFDGTNDYISSNATIGRTGYDMNVSGNVTTGSDGDGSYIQFNGNRDSVSVTGSRSDLSVTGPTFTQATSFTMKVRTKPISNTPNSSSGYFSYNNVAGITSDNSSGGRFKVGMRSGATVLEIPCLYTLGSIYNIYLVYDSITQNFFVYSNGVLQNPGGTAIPGAFTASTNLFLGDQGSLAGISSSSNKYIYHASIRNKALTQAEIDADIALGNTVKNDPSIVAYYIPENLQYNTQYMSNPKSLDNAVRSKGSGITVTADTTVAPDGTTTADTVAYSGGGLGSNVTQLTTAISGSTIASKTFIVKAFMKCSAGTQSVRLRCQHQGVSDYLSSDLTVTTDWQEFTFTKTFTSSTSGTGINAGIVQGSGGAAYTIQVRNVRLFLVNETLRDESPNIGGFIGWKTQQALSCRVKPNADSTNSANAFTLMLPSYIYVHIRDTNNAINFRYDSTRVPSGSVAAGYILGNGFRSKVHITAVLGFSAGVRTLKLYVGGVLRSTVAITNQPPTTNYNTLFWMGRKGTNYFSGNIRDARIYTFTGSFTNADALAIYNGGEPTSSGVTKYLHYRPPVGEVGTTTQDQSPNDRDGTLNNGVTRNYI